MLQHFTEEFVSPYLRCEAVCLIPCMHLFHQCMKSFREKKNNSENTRTSFWELMTRALRGKKNNVWVSTLSMPTCGSCKQCMKNAGNLGCWEFATISIQYHCQIIESNQFCMFGVSDMCNSWAMRSYCDINSTQTSYGSNNINVNNTNLKPYTVAETYSREKVQTCM